MRSVKELLDKFNLPEGWTVVKVLRSGHEEVVASGVSLSEAERLADQILKRRIPGVTVSLRESLEIGF